LNLFSGSSGTGIYVYNISYGVRNMKNRLWRLYIITIGGVIVLSVFSGCFSKSDQVIPTKGMTSVETVQFFFEQWNNKNTNGRNSVVRDEMKNTDYGRSSLIYVKLTKSIDETEKYLALEGTYFSDTFPNYTEYSIVEVEFEIEYKKSLFFSNAGGFHDGKSVIDNWRFVLGKTRIESDWVIVSWGF